MSAGMSTFRKIRVKPRVLKSTEKCKSLTLKMASTFLEVASLLLLKYFRMSGASMSLAYVKTKI